MENLINKEMPCSSYCWLANRFAIITRVPDYLYLIWDELNMVVLKENNRIHFIGKNNIREVNSHFRNLLTFSELKTLEILEFCRESLKENRSILVKVDKFFIKACSQYKDRHEFYEILIYGENENGFYFLNLNDRTKTWDAKVLSTEELGEGYLSALNLKRNDYYEFVNIFCGNELLCVNVGLKDDLQLNLRAYDFLSDILEIGKQYSSKDLKTIEDIQDEDYLIIYLKVLIDIRIMFVKKIGLLPYMELEVDSYYTLCDKMISLYKKRLMILIRHSIRSDKSDKNNLIEGTIDLINDSEKQLWLKLYSDVSHII